jgi:hypothetical protein
MATTNSLTQPPADELRLVEVSANFLREIANLTPGKSLEAKLNKQYGPSSGTYQQVRVFPSYFLTLRTDAS